MEAEDLWKTLLLTLIDNAIYAIVGLSFGFIAKSMAGAVTLSLVFFFVIDGFFTLIPKVGQYAMDKAIAAFNSGIYPGFDVLSGYSDHDSFGKASLIILVWMAIFVGLGVFRFLKSDVK